MKMAILHNRVQEIRAYSDPHYAHLDAMSLSKAFPGLALFVVGASEVLPVDLNRGECYRHEDAAL